MELADRTESELHDLYVLKYGPVVPPIDLFVIPADEDLMCPIKREYAFRYMMRNQGAITRQLRNAEMEINKVRQEVHNLVQQLNMRQTMYGMPYNHTIPITYGTSTQAVPLPPNYFTSITL